MHHFSMHPEMVHFHYSGTAQQSPVWHDRVGAECLRPEMRVTKGASAEGQCVAVREVDRAIGALLDGDEVRLALVGGHEQSRKRQESSGDEAG